MQITHVEHPALRALAVLPAALLTTLVLSYFMMRLIAQSDVKLDEVQRIKLNSIFLEVPEIETPPYETPQPPQAIQPQPAVLDLFPATEFGGEVIPIPLDPAPSSDDDRHQLSFVSTALVKMNAVSPQYPFRALRNGIEGYVDVEFDISVNGYPNHIRVIDAQPSGYFEDAATRAVAMWKYRLPEIDGASQSVRAHRERIRFEIGGSNDR